MANQFNDELMCYKNYESILLMHKLLTGKINTRECRVDRNTMRFKSYIDNFIGTPVIETLVFVARMFDKSILDTKTFSTKFELLEKEVGGQNRIYYYDGKIYCTEEITNKELKTAKSIYTGKHSLVKAVKELFAYTTPLELTYGDYSFLDNLDFKISSVANLLSALGVNYFNKAPFNTQIEHMVGAYSDGRLAVYFKNGKTAIYNSEEDYCRAISCGEFYYE